MSYLRAAAGWLINKWETEPLAVTAVVDGVLVLAVTFGLPVTSEQKGAIDTLLAAIGVLVARKQVYPAATVAKLTGLDTTANPPPSG